MRGSSRSRFTAIGIAAASAALYPVLIDGRGETEEPRVLRSPGGRWSCLFVRDPVREDMKVYLAPSDRLQDRKLLLECARWAGGQWSPDERWFAVFRQPDGHMTDLGIYRISGEPATSWNAEAEYRTLQQDRYDAHWRIVSWNIAEGMIRISCEFRPDLDNPAVVNRTYLVPIDLQPSKGQRKRLRSRSRP